MSLKTLTIEAKLKGQAKSRKLFMAYELKGRLHIYLGKPVKEIETS